MKILMKETLQLDGPLYIPSIKTYANLQDAAPDRVQKITTTVDSAPDADDNFGFNETTSEWV